MAIKKLLMLLSVAVIGCTIVIPTTPDNAGPDVPVDTTPTVPNVNAEPTFGGANVTLWKDDFNYTDISGVYQRYATMNGEQGLFLDPSGVNSSPALRIDWKASTACTDDGHLIEGSLPRAERNIVIQYWVRYQSGFVFDWLQRSPCGGNAKKLFLLWATEGSRFNFISENHKLGIGPNQIPLYTQNVNGVPLTPEEWGDGQWHRITIRLQQSSSLTATDGYVYGWIDGVQRWKVDNVATNSIGGWALFKMPSTFNQGSPVNQSEWMDNLHIWY